MVKLKDIVKTDKIIKVSPEETLSSALAKTKTSHDAVFIFDSKDNFLGVINPYYTVIKSSYPGNAKVEHCLFHPPKIRINFPIAKVAKLFIESKIHYLPVFDSSDKFEGILSARHLLGQLKHWHFFNVKIDSVLRQKHQPIITVTENDSINTAINIFKKTKISKLIVIDENLKLKGILSYYDLVSYLMSPRYSPHKGEREGNRVSFYHYKVKHFAKTYALTLTPRHHLSDALELILSKKIGSVVIVDSERHPIGIITTKDFLGLILREEGKQNFQLIGKNLSNQSRQIIGGFFNRFLMVIREVPGLTAAKLFVKEERHGDLFKVILSLFGVKGKTRHYTREGKNLIQILFPLHDIFNKVKKNNHF